MPLKDALSHTQREAIPSQDTHTHCLSHTQKPFHCKTHILTVTHAERCYSIARRTYSLSLSHAEAIDTRCLSHTQKPFMLTVSHTHRSHSYSLSNTHTEAIPSQDTPTTKKDKNLLRLWYLQLINGTFN